MTTRRPDRVAHLIQQTISDLILHEVRDQRLSPVVITASRVTSDLRLAHVYYTILAGDDRQRARDEATAALAHASPFIRREIGRIIRLRYTPELMFHFDETLEEARRIEELISTIQPVEMPPDGDDQGAGD